MASLPLGPFSLGSRPLRHKALLLINFDFFFNAKTCNVAQDGLKLSHFNSAFPMLVDTIQHRAGQMDFLMFG